MLGRLPVKVRLMIWDYLSVPRTRYQYIDECSQTCIDRVGWTPVWLVSKTIATALPGCLYRRVILLTMQPDMVSSQMSTFLDDGKRVCFDDVVSSMLPVFGTNDQGTAKCSTVPWGSFVGIKIEVRAPYRASSTSSKPMVIKVWSAYSWLVYLFEDYVESRNGQCPDLILLSSMMSTPPGIMSTRLYTRFTMNHSLGIGFMCPLAFPTASARLSQILTFCCFPFAV